MAGRYVALGRSLRRKEARTGAPQAPPPPPLALDPPPLASGTSNQAPSSGRPKKRSNYGLQRDYKILEREKKVSSVLENATFRGELEEILQGQLDGKNRPVPPTRPTPDQWLTDLSGRPSHQGPRQPVAGGGELVIPINDLRGIAASKYTLAQRQLRCKVAAVFRLAHMLGWNQLMHTHITAYSPGVETAVGYLVNALGLLYHEVTASNLLCVDLEGRVLDPGSTQLGIDDAGWVLHSAIHKARRDIKCIIHISNAATVAVSAMNCGLLQISIEAIAVGGASYLHFLEIEREDVEDEIASVLGSNKVLILRNHGAVAMGESIEEAFSIALKLVKACDIQVAAMPAGLSNITQAPDGNGVWSKCGGRVQAHEQAGVRWKPGEINFEAFMRMLDNKGYKTGYDYRGLDLLQPGKQEDSTESREPKEQPISLKNETTSKPKKLVSQVTEAKKEPWEFLEDEMMIDVSTGGLKKLNTAATAELQPPLRSGEPDTSGHDDSVTSSNDRLQSLQATAKQVAKSTSDAFKKLERKETGLSLLQLASQTAQHVEKSTKDSLQKLEKRQDGGTILETAQQPSLPKYADVGVTNGGGDATNTMDVVREGEEANLLEVAKQTAERVARSTGNAASKLSGRGESLDPLEHIQMTAKHVAKSTNDAVWRLAKGQHQESEDQDSHQQKKDEKFPHTLSTSSPSFIPGPSPSLSPTLLSPSPTPLSPSPSPPPSLSPSPPPSPSPSPQNRTHRVNGLTKILTNGSVVPNGARHYQLLHSSPMHLLTPPPPPGADDTIRTLPSLPSLSFVMELPTSDRMLPRVPETGLISGISRIESPRKLSNSYYHRSLPLLMQNLKKKAVPSSLDSDSEYSTTESIELSQPVLLSPSHARTVAKSHLDLETNPSENMVHTAQMVAESTGKAMHKLTTTLPHY